MRRSRAGSRCADWLAAGAMAETAEGTSTAAAAHTSSTTADTRADAGPDPSRDGGGGKDDRDDGRDDNVAEIADSATSGAEDPVTRT